MKSTILSSETHQGELYAISQSFLWGLFPIFSILSFSSLPPLFAASISTFVAAIFFAITLTIKKKWHEIMIRSAWKDLLYTTLIIGVLFYVLVFIGMQKTTAGNTSIILLMEILFSIVILRAWKKENLSRKQIIGSFLMGIGALLVLFPGHFQINEGDIIILIAAAVPPIGNYFAQNARKKISSHTIMFVRSILAGFFILVLAFIFEKTPSASAIPASTLFIIVNGFLILGLSKALWLEAIHRIPISKALSLASIAPVFTLIFAYFMLNEIPSLWQILGFLPIFIGITLLTTTKRGR